jgi:hypothetical protein
MRDLPKEAFRIVGSMAVAGAAIVGSNAGWAQGSEPSSLKVTGFLSVVDGRVLSSTLDPATYSGVAAANGVSVPFYTADWSNAGVYGEKYSIAPESHAGIQVTYSLTDSVNLVGQLVVRGTDGTPEVTWAYAGYKLNKNWEVQVGRKRIPLYYYSDFQDIGVSYPWVSTPPELYGWDATNYNGASVRYSGAFGNSNVTASLFAGDESISKSAYNKLLYAGDTKVDWNNIVGTDVEFNNGPATIRAVYVKSNTNTANADAGYDANAALTAYGIAANLDFDSWFILSEVTTLKREFAEARYSYTAPAFTLGVGVRLGKWTPFLNYAKYTEDSSDLLKYSPQSYQRTSATLRYDLNSASAIKMQLDCNKDVTNNFGGDTTIFRVSYDLVF